MDNQKIFIVNLSKGRIGEDNTSLLGTILITKLQTAAMSRVDIPEETRKDFFLYIDEFQTFATPSFAGIKAVKQLTMSVTKLSDEACSPIIHPVVRRLWPRITR